MGTPDDDPAVEWLDDHDTFITGAVPEPAEDADETTPRRALCADCLSPTMPGGALATTSAEWDRVAHSEACLRGERWDYCARRGRLSIWLKRTG